MIPHQTPGVHLPTRLGASFSQRGQKPPPITVVPDNYFSPISAAHEVINGTSVLQALLAGHVACSTPSLGQYQYQGLTPSMTPSISSIYVGSPASEAEGNSRRRVRLRRIGLPVKCRTLSPHLRTKCATFAAASGFFQGFRRLVQANQALASRARSFTDLRPD